MSERDQLVAVAAIVFDDSGRVLAMRRSKQNAHGSGLWETLSGRVERGEDPIVAIRREIDEECALRVILDERPVTCYAALRGDAPMIVIVFRAKRIDGEVRMSAEHDEFAWWSAEEFRSRSTLTLLANAVELAASLPW